MEHHELAPHIRFETEVVGAAWDDDRHTWTVETRGRRRHGRDPATPAR